MHRTEDQYAVGQRFTNGPPGTRVGADFLNAVQEEICGVIEGAGLVVENQATESNSQLLASIRSLIGLDTSAREKWTRANGGQWCNFAWKDPTHPVIKCKPAQGLGSFIGVVLPNTNKYFELQSDYVMYLAIPGAGGNILDGITAVLNNEWYIPWAYENSAGSLAFGFTWMTNTTFSNANPTNTLTLNQVNGQNIGYLYPIDGDLAIFQNTNEWETPYAWQDAGAVTYDPTKTKPRVLSRTSTVLTLGANLQNTTFTATTPVYQVSGFKPLQVSDGNISSYISTRGYRDMGIRFLTDGAAGIRGFSVHNDYVWFTDFLTINPATGAAVYRPLYIPPDKEEMYSRVADPSAAANTFTQYFMYWEATGKWAGDRFSSGGFIVPLPIRHGLVKVNYTGTGVKDLCFGAYRL